MNRLIVCIQVLSCTPVPSHVITTGPRSPAASLGSYADAPLSAPAPDTAAFTTAGNSQSALPTTTLAVRPASGKRKRLDSDIGSRDSEGSPIGDANNARGSVMHRALPQFAGPSSSGPNEQDSVSKTASARQHQQQLPQQQQQQLPHQSLHDVVQRDQSHRHHQQQQQRQLPVDAVWQHSHQGSEAMWIAELDRVIAWCQRMVVEKHLLAELQVSPTGCIMACALA